MIDINWTLTANVPQIEVWGERIVAELQGIRDAMAELGTQQAAGSEAIASQLTVIANEIAQLDAEAISQEQIDKLAGDIRAAAQLAEEQAAQVRANSQQIAGMVPDDPPPA